MKIIVCSTKNSVRERWSSILAEHGYLMHQVSFAENLEQLIQKDNISLILLHQPFADFQKIHELCKESDSYKVFVLTDDPNEEDGMLFMHLGVSGYANTYTSPARLLESVKMILSGRVWFKQEIINKLIQSLKAKNKKDDSEVELILSPLSEREKEIAILISEGLSNMEIGEKLFISERTVKSHLGTIFSKTGTHSRLQLALLIIRGKE